MLISIIFAHVTVRISSLNSIMKCLEILVSAHVIFLNPNDYKMYTIASTIYYNMYYIYYAFSCSIYSSWSNESSYK